MNKDTVRQILNVLALIAVLAVNFLSEALPLNGQTSAEIANRLPILFVPANYVFGIWGVIYILLVAFTAYQALPSQRENPMLRRVGYWFALSCVANATWLICFHYNLFPLSMVAMIVLLVALIVIYTRLEIGQKALALKEKWLLHIPFSVYLGWITVATVANAAYVLYDAHWNGFGISDTAWATLMLAVATGITLIIIRTRSDIAYTCVIVWAFLGIMVKQSGTPLVATTAIAMAALVVLVLMARWIIRRNKSGGLTTNPA